MSEAFVPRRGLRGGHLQTLAGHFLPRRNLLPAAEGRLFTVDEGVQVRCDCHWQQERSAAVTIVIVHGLEGSSESSYVIGTGSKAWAAGMNVVRMNLRNCGGTEGLAPTLYHSGLSGDVGAVVNELITRDRLPQVAIAGFSMGGNLVLKLAGEWGSAAPREVEAFAAVCPGMDLAASAAELHRASNRIYEWRFLLSLWCSMGRKAQLFPEIFQRPGWRALRSLRDFDDEVTARYCGFANAADYYARASASPLVPKIAVPTLVIHSEDDPFVLILPETRAALRANWNVRFIETKHGGHCAFIEKANGCDGRWAERQIIEFFRNITLRQTLDGPPASNGIINLRAGDGAVVSGQ
ncbi:MAG: alpha/beta fold hydrolase [Acidobacteriia bacterium]|nr:alpha/beta fold hydrolase [Terriglobia bacterium]